MRRGVGEVGGGNDCQGFDTPPHFFIAKNGGIC